MSDTRKRLTQADVQGIREAAQQGLVGGKIKSRLVVFTGKMSMRREDMQALARACGAYVDMDVRQRRNGILVVGDTSIHGRTSKMRKAEALGWSIVSESEFVEMATSRG